MATSRVKRAVLHEDTHILIVGSTCPGQVIKSCHALKHRNKNPNKTDAINERIGDERREG